ncbi:MAG: electron transfer complex ferredoxin TmcB, partial [Oceanidesulfovibrio sp.]
MSDTTTAPETKKKDLLQPVYDDPGIMRGLEKLDEATIERVINQTLEAEGGARLKILVDTCVHCSLCSDACHFFVSHDRDPKYSPVGKVKQTIWGMIKNKGKVSKEYLMRAAQVAHTECNLCRRCVQYCPFGIDTAHLIALTRRICHKLGITPQYLQDTAHSHSATYNQMWVKEDEWVDSLYWQEDEARDELPTLRIPVEKEGAEIFYSVIGPEPKFRTQLIYQAAAIFHEAGSDWTMPSTPGWDNSDMCMFTGDYEMMGRIKKYHFEAAMKLKVKKIVMGECGHAFRSIYDQGNRWLGWKMHPIRVMHAIEFYHELLETGQLKVAKTFDKIVTLHDPCNIIRGRGLMEQAREVVKAFCPNFVEMTPNREHNYCCCAGGGVINCGPPFKNVRVNGNKVKAEQLAATGAKVII